MTRESTTNLSSLEFAPQKVSRNIEQSILEHLSAVIYATDLDHTLIYLNHAPEGKNRRDFLGHNAFEFIHPDDHDAALACRKRVLETGQPASYHTVAAERELGGIQSAEVRPLKVAGVVAGFLVVVSDISEQEQLKDERERVVAAAKLQQGRFKALTEQNSDLVVIVDEKGKLIYINPAHRRKLGYSDQELKASRFRKFVHPDDYQTITRYLRLAVGASGTDLSLPPVRVCCADGTWIVLEPIINDLRDVEGVGGFVVTSRDITERIRAEKDVRNFKTISDRANYGTAIADRDGNILYVNEAWARMHEMEVEDVLGRSLSIFHSPTQMRQVYDMNERLERDGTYTAQEIWHITKSGREFPTLMNGTAVKDEDGQSFFISATAVDITELKLKEAEIRKLNETLEERVSQRTDELRDAQAQLVEAEKMASLGGLVTGVAHEINTPVGVGVTAASHLVEQTERISKLLDGGEMKKSDLTAFIEISRKTAVLIATNLERAARLINNFKSIAVDTSLDGLQRIRIRDCLDNSLIGIMKDVEGRIGHVDLVCDPGLEVQAGPEDFSLVLRNLILNSVTHGFDGRKPGRIEIRVKQVNDTVELIYRDDGIGMSSDVLSRVFDPFFTTRPGGENTGLGMHIVYNLIVHKMGGQIFCSSNPGKGSEFRIIIPQSESERV